MHNSRLKERYQFAYKQLHSIDTALLCIANDILHGGNEKKAVLLVLLDLTAAFVSVDHDVCWIMSSID